MTEAEIGEQAAALANDMERLVTGKPRAVVIVALAMVAAAGESDVPRPDIEGFLRVFCRVVRETFAHRLGMIRLLRGTVQ